jgi:hypothetical protein
MATVVATCGETPENPHPCARFLVDTGFMATDVATWGKTGGIPDDAVPFILSHYGMEAAGGAGVLPDPQEDPQEGQ